MKSRSMYARSTAVGVFGLAVLLLRMLPTETRSIEIGAFTGVSPPTAAAINGFETLAGRHVYSVAWYQGWDAANQPAFPTAELAAPRYHDGYDTQVVLHLTWEPWVNLTDIANGSYDAYLTAYAAAARAWREPVRLRFAHEMIQDDVLNGNEWYPWQDQPSAYKAAFRHVHDVFHAVGANNVQFVWCPNNYPFDLNIVTKYYAGSDVVDWLCMDGYNPTNQDGQPGWPDWQWFDDIFYPIYHTLVDHSDVFGDKPVMIGEFASCEAGFYELPGQTKAAWIQNAFERIKSADYARLQAFYWFHINKECDWRVNSSSDSLMAFRAALSDHVFASHYIPAGIIYLPAVLRETNP